MERYNADLLSDVLQQHKYELIRILKLIPHDPEANGQEVITATRRHNVFQYFLYSPGNNAHLYLSKAKKHKLIQKLCQREYYTNLRNALESQLFLLDSVLPKLQDNNPAQVFHNLHEGKQAVLTPIVVDDETYSSWWQSRDYIKKDPSDATHSTDRGDLVRSKSEVLIANQLYKRHIPYRYEEEVYLEGYGHVHPDFTVLNPRTRKEYYWEHLGMIDDETYATKNFNKLLTYSENGYDVGNRLIITLETLAHPLDTRKINHIIEEFLQ